MTTRTRIYLIILVLSVLTLLGLLTGFIPAVIYGGQTGILIVVGVPFSVVITHILTGEPDVDPDSHRTA